MKSLATGIDTARPITKELAERIREQNHGFVMRYLAPDSLPIYAKRLTAPEAKILSGTGLAIGTIYETAAGRAGGGAANGAYDGEQAMACAAENRIPDYGCIYFAVDYDAAEEDLDRIEAYLLAAKEKIGAHPIGVYGKYDVIEAMHARGVCNYFWQCVGWSSGKISVHANIYQYAWDQAFEGITVDFNHQYGEAGLWNYEEDDMTGEQIFEKLNAYLAEQSCPDWAKAELQEAIDAGITDGERPMQLVPRYQAAIMAKRAVEAKNSD